MSDDEFSFAVERIANGGSNADEIAEALCFAHAISKRAKQIRETLEAAMLRHVQSCGSLVIGDMLYYAGFPTKTSTKNKLAALDALLVHTCGDLFATSNLLIAQPFKCASIRSVLPARLFASTFRIVRDASLGKRLLSANTRFLRHRALELEEHQEG